MVNIGLLSPSQSSKSPVFSPVFCMPSCQTFVPPLLKSMFASPVPPVARVSARSALPLAVAEPSMTKAGVSSPVFDDWISRSVYGEVVAIPTLPPVNIAAAPVPDCVTASVGVAEVDEAKIPPCAQNGVVEAIVVVPKVVAIDPPHAVYPRLVPVEPPTHTLLMLKHPVVRLMPPAFSKVDVAREKLMPDALPETPRERRVPGVEVAMPVVPCTIRPPEGAVVFAKLPPSDSPPLSKKNVSWLFELLSLSWKDFPVKPVLKSTKPFVSSRFALPCCIFS